MSEPVQADLFTANAAWVHVLRDFMRSGQAAKIGGQGILVYLSIKTYTDFATGRAFPPVATIAKEAGISERQVLRELKRLEEMGHLKKERHGRNNVYVLQERVGIYDGNNRRGDASWEYVPNNFANATAELRHAVKSGNFDTSMVKIEINLNITQNITNSGDGIQIVADTTGITGELKKRLDSLLQNALGPMHDELSTEGRKLDAPEGS